MEIRTNLSIFFLCLALLTGYTSLIQARVAVTTESVTGTVVQVDKDGIITLKDKGLYVPKNARLAVNFPPGTIITIFFTREGDRNLYFTVKEGNESIQAQTPPSRHHPSPRY